jgi:aminoglycoside 3-N-acetyltransferase
MGLNSHFIPYARESSWGKLLDQKAAILLIGVDLRRFTYIHGVEEWLDIPARLTSSRNALHHITG